MRRGAAVRSPRTAATSARSPASPPSRDGDAWLDAVLAVLDHNRDLLGRAARRAPARGRLRRRRPPATSPGSTCARSSSATTPRRRSSSAAASRSARARVRHAGRGLRAAQLRHLPRPARGDRRADGEGGRPWLRRRDGMELDRSGRWRRWWERDRARARADSSSSTRTRTSAATTPTASSRRRRSCWRRSSRPARAPSSSRCTSPTATRPPTTSRCAAAAAPTAACVAFARVDPHAGAARRGAPLPRRRRARDQAPPARRALHARRAGRADLFALAHERRVPVLIHAGRGIPALGRDTRRARRASTPSARLILAHAAVSDLAWLWRVMPEHPNLLIDTAVVEPGRPDRAVLPGSRRRRSSGRATRPTACRSTRP